VIGADLSLIRPGLAVVDPDRSPFVETLRLPSLRKYRKPTPAKPATKRKAAQDADPGVPLDLAARFVRMDETLCWLRDEMARGCELLVVEGMYLDRISADLLERAWLWGRAVGQACDRGIPVGVVWPSVLKEFATGDSQADKKVMLAAARAAWPDVEITDDNSADAMWLAAAGAAKLGRPVESVPLAQAASLYSAEWPAEWPELLSDDGDAKENVA
jgi:Holliday junction resolvasome RuvABC endonuclease subunit